VLARKNLLDRFAAMRSKRMPETDLKSQRVHAGCSVTGVTDSSAEPIVPSRRRAG
jgi:hypothetical protein